MGTTAKQRARAAQQYRQQDHFVADVIGAIGGGGLKKIGEALGVNAITPGIIDRKLAAAILGARSLGYSDEQIRQEPLYGVIAALGELPISIQNIVENAPHHVKTYAKDRGITLPRPELNAYPYKGAPEGGPASAAIIAPIFGEGVASLSKNRQKIVMLPGPNVPGVTEPVSARVQDATQKQTQVSHDPSAEVLRPLMPMMQTALSDTGVIPPSTLDATAQLFYDKVVVPGSGETFSLDEDIVEAILTFVAAKAAKKAAGESQSPIYDKIGEATLRVESKLTDAARRQVDTKVGGFLTQNLPLFILAIVALIAFASMGRAAK